MTVATFEGLAPDGGAAFFDSHKKLKWQGILAVDDDIFFQPGQTNVLTSGEAIGSTDMEVPGEARTKGEDFTLKSGFFAAGDADALVYRIVAFDDGVKVGVQKLTLDTSRSFIEFGNDFKSIDKIKFEFVSTDRRFELVMDDLTYSFEEPAPAAREDWPLG
jgi:hypothetical protein